VTAAIVLAYYLWVAVGAYWAIGRYVVGGKGSAGKLTMRERKAFLYLGLCLAMVWPATLADALLDRDEK
jgi:hypothetical protein